MVDYVYMVVMFLFSYIAYALKQYLKEIKFQNTIV